MSRAELHHDKGDRGTSTPKRIYVAVNRAELDPIFDEPTRERFEAIGDVRYGPDLPGVALPDGVADEFDVVVTSWCTMPPDPGTLVGRRLRLAAHAAGSVRALFPPAVLQGPLRIVQCGAAAMAEPVAEMALALTLALLRNVHSHDRRLQQTRDWVRGGHGEVGRSLRSLRTGVVGLSRTGRHYVRMVRGIGAEDLVAYDPYVSDEEGDALGVRLVGLHELCKTSDVVAVHAPVTPETVHMIGEKELGAMRDGAVLINTARSALVDQAALVRELHSGRISAGLDVFDEEPLPADSPLFGLPNALLMPHVAGGTRTARLEQGATVVREIERFLRGEPLEHEVTFENYGRLA